MRKPRNEHKKNITAFEWCISTLTRLLFSFMEIQMEWVNRTSYLVSSETKRRQVSLPLHPNGCLCVHAFIFDSISVWRSKNRIIIMMTQCMCGIFCGLIVDFCLPILFPHSDVWYLGIINFAHKNGKIVKQNWKSRNNIRIDISNALNEWTIKVNRDRGAWITQFTFVVMSWWLTHIHHVSLKRRHILFYFRFVSIVETMNINHSLLYSI